jgi:hypothetical protein
LQDIRSTPVGQAVLDGSYSFSAVNEPTRLPR